MVHIPDVKKITLMEQVADDYQNLGKQGRFSKKCIPRGYMLDFNWTTIHEGQDQPINQFNNRIQLRTLQPQLHPQEVEGPPSSHLRSKTKQQSTTREQGQLKCNPAQQGQLECNPAQQGQPECNPAQIEVNTVEIAPKHYSLMQWTKTLLWAKGVSKHKAPVAARCTLIVAMAVYRLKCDQANTIVNQFLLNSYFILSGPLTTPTIGKE